MKKILSIILLLLIALPAYTITRFEAGRNSYYAKDYEKAKYYFYNEVKQKPDNYEAYYFLGLSYLHLNDARRAKISFSKVIELAPKHVLTYQYAQKELLKLKDIETYEEIQQKDEELKEKENLKDNYYDYMKTNQKFMTIKEFPVSVYIEPYEHTSWVKQAFINWQIATKRFVTFRIVDTPEEAKIIVKTTKKPFPTGKHGLLLGVAEWKYDKDKYLHSAKITVLKRNPNDKTPYSKEHFISVMEHEIGHVLGLGHSSTCEDIMGTNCSAKYSSNRKITQRDINTLKLLYRSRQ